MNKSEPIISVIMPAYNAQDYIAEAIESILKQIYQNFEFIIVNDGSKDRTLEIINKYKQSDSRIVLISKDNGGIVDAINKGLSIARGEFIARMDADDISHEKRFAIQLKYMTDNPSISAISCAVKHIGSLDSFAFPSTCSEQLNLMPELVHPGLFFRNKDICENKIKFKRNDLHAEDAGFLNTIASNGLTLGNMEEPLLKYRVHSASVSQKHSLLQQATYKRIVRERFSFIRDEMDVNIFLKRSKFCEEEVVKRFELIERSVFEQYGRNITGRYFLSSYYELFKRLSGLKKIYWFWKYKTRVVSGTVSYILERLRYYYLSAKYKHFWNEL